MTAVVVWPRKATCQLQEGGAGLRCARPGYERFASACMHRQPHRAAHRQLWQASGLLHLQAWGAVPQSSWVGLMMDTCY